jgi:hypothetical protein
MNVTITGQPPFDPVTLQDVYKSLRLDTEGSPETHADDSLLSSLITAATKHVEHMGRFSLIRRHLRVSYSGFPPKPTEFVRYTPAARMNSVNALAMIYPPVLSISSVKYYDADNTLQTISHADYFLPDQQQPQVVFVSGFIAPTVYDRPDAVQINYYAGYRPSVNNPTTQAEYAANVPTSIKRAIILQVQALYDDLAPADYARVQSAIEALIQPYRIQIAL